MPSQFSQLLPVLTVGRSVEVPLLHTQLSGSQRRRSQASDCDGETPLRIYAEMTAPLKTTDLASVVWLVLAESLVLLLASAAIGLALSTVMVPALGYRPAFTLEAMPLVEIAVSL